MEPQDINSIEDLFEVLDTYLVTPRRPGLTGDELNTIIKKMSRYRNKLVAFNSLSTITISQSSVSEFFENFLKVSFWNVDTSAVGYNSANKATWKVLPFDAPCTITLDSSGNPLNYTFDFGGVIEHGFYQIN